MTMTIRVVLFSIALVLANTITSQNKVSNEKDFYIKNPITQIRSQPDISVRSDVIDLGDGMSLLGSDIDPNSTLLTVTVNSSQWANLTDESVYYKELQEITKKIFTKFNDDFDFIFYVLDSPLDQNIISSLGFWGVQFNIKNDIEGLGSDFSDNSSTWGTAGKLNSAMFFPFADAIIMGPTLHELAHKWAAYIVPTYDPENEFNGSHWGVSNAGGQLGGFKYIREVEQNSGGQQGRTKYQASFRSNETNTDGTFKQPGFGVDANGGNGLPYSDIELYLMGMKSAQELRNSGFRLDIYNGNDIEYEGDNSFANGYFYSRTKTSYTIDDIIAINGERIPDAASSQKQFKVLTVALNKETAETHYNNIIANIKWLSGSIDDKTYPNIYNFKQATYGVGSLVTSEISNSVKKPEIIKLNKTNTILKPEQEEQLTASNSSGETIIWSSSNNSVAIVSNSGLIKAISEGRAVITASISGGFSASCYVYVTTPPCTNPTASGITGSLTWALCPNGTLTISGEGAMGNYQQRQAPWYDYRNNIRTLIIKDKVTSIGNSAFYYCSSLTSVTIPNTVTSIGSNAFYSCNNLTSVNIPTSVTKINNYAFSSSGLTTISIPNSVKTINNNAFANCHLLTSVTIPKSVLFIGSGAFIRCSKLTSINIDPENQAYTVDNGLIYSKDKTLLHTCPESKKGEFVIPDGVKTIGNNAFFNCSNLTSITIPNSVTRIENSAFTLCSGLTSIEIPNSVTLIDRSAFSSCDNVKNLTIPNSVTYINRLAFSSCSALKYISVEWTIPLGITEFVFEGINTTDITLSVPAGTKSKYNTARVWKDFGTIIEEDLTHPCSFPTEMGSTGLLTWSLCPDGTLTISGEGAMNDYLEQAPWDKFQNDISTVIIKDKVTSIGNNAFSSLYNVTSVSIPNSVTTINDYALAYCSKITSIKLPNSLTYIGNNAFSGCSGLTQLEIPNLVTTIGGFAFANCSAIKSIKIPNSVTSIGFLAFYYTSPDNVTVEWTIPLGIDDFVFSGVDIGKATLYVPEGTKSKYEVAPVWKDFGTIIEKKMVANQVIKTDVNTYVSDNILYINSPVNEDVML